MTRRAQLALGRIGCLSCCAGAQLLAGGCLMIGHASASTATWEAGATIIYQRAADGPADGDLTASADLVVSWQQTGGSWILHLEGSTTPDADGVSAVYPLVNADAGTAIDSSGNGRVQMSELYYRFRSGPGHTLALGIVDLTRWLDTSWIANDENHHFLNRSFVNNAAIAFPDYTPGAVYVGNGTGGRPEIVLVATSAAGIADSADRSYPSLFDVNEDGEGAFFAAQGGWEQAHRFARLGVWLRTDDNPVLTDPTATGNNYGYYAVLGGRAGVHEMDVRLGIANDEVSRAAKNLALAYQRTVGTGLAGIGWARTWLSDVPAAPGPSQSSFAELFYRWPIGDGAAHLTPSLQYLTDPASTGQGIEAVSDALVFGLRFHWSLSN